ncbi:MAG: two-component regulator propeller domain-containing protein, partial [Ignavibacteriaceae bacterium]
KKLTLISLIIIVCSSTFLFPEEPSLGQADRINYVHILSEDGLSQNTVHSIIQDKEGFIWFATEDGLNKYDGYNFKIFKNNPQEKNSIPDNFIWTIYEDRNGTLWVGTNNKGLCRFDRSTEQFITYNSIPGHPTTPVHNNVRSIYEDREGNLWVGTEGGLDKFDRKKKVFIHYRNIPGDPNSLSNNVVLSIFEDKSGELFFIEFNQPIQCTYPQIPGFILTNRKNETFKRHLMGTPGPYGSNINRINSLLEDKNGMLWIATGSGLFQINTTENHSTTIPKPYNTNMLNGNNVLSLYEDNSGLIWIGTAEDGVIKFDKERIKFKYYAHDSFNPSSLSYGTIRAIYKEDNGTLWVGTLGGGLNKLEPSSSKFIHYKNAPPDKYSLSDNSVSAIFKDSYGYLWIGTWRGGLNRSVLPLSKTSGNLKFKHYKNEPSNPNSLSNNLIQSIFEDSGKRLWIGTGIGLNLYNRKNDNFIIFKNNPYNPNSISEDQVQSCIIQDRNGNLWVGTWNGLNKLTFAELNNVLNNPSSVKFIHFRNTQNNLGLSDDRVISAYEDQDGNLWFGTYGGGLNMLSPEQQNERKPHFIHYTIKDGLPSNVIYAIQGDNNSNIWISTDNGLSSINTRTNNIRNYDANDGLQGNQFFWGASFKSRNNELFFGGTKGLNAFYPEDLRRNKHIPPIVITSFQIFNKPVEINEKNSPLKKSITETKEIELSYGQNVFSFEFSALDYVSPYKNRYAYMMEGFDENWIYSGNRRYITYTNLDPGKYVFKVKGSNNDGVWNEKGVQLTIRILPPLWRTWWFITLASITILGIIGLIVYFRVKNLIEIGRFRTKLAADLHDNIGSSLTEISILSEVISKKIKTEEKEVTKSLKAISTNARSLVDNMSDIVWLVNPKRDSLYDLILRLRDTYSELSSYTNISFRSENIISLQKVSLSMEHRQNLYLIFKEAINNCITHSSCTEINLDASVKGRILEMTLKDNGEGFRKEDIKDGNGLGNMKNRAKKIGGHLNIDSKIGEGTIIQFQGNIS